MKYFVAMVASAGILIALLALGWIWTMEHSYAAIDAWESNTAKVVKALVALCAIVLQCYALVKLWGSRDKTCRRAVVIAAMHGVLLILPLLLLHPACFEVLNYRRSHLPPHCQVIRCGSTEWVVFHLGLKLYQHPWWMLIPTLGALWTDVLVYLLLHKTCGLRSAEMWVKAVTFMLCYVIVWYLYCLIWGTYAALHPPCGP